MDMRHNSLRASRLKEIKDILQDYFAVNAKSSTHHHQHHHHHYHEHTPLNPLPFIVFPAAPPAQVTIIQTETSQKKEEKENKKPKSQDTSLKVAAVVLGVGASFVGTYVVAKDEYINYYLSGLEEKMASLHPEDPEGKEDRQLR